VNEQQLLEQALAELEEADRLDDSSEQVLSAARAAMEQGRADFARVSGERSALLAAGKRAEAAELDGQYATARNDLDSLKLAYDHAVAGLAEQRDRARALRRNGGEAAFRLYRLQANAASLRIAEYLEAVPALIDEVKAANRMANEVQGRAALKFGGAQLGRVHLESAKRIPFYAKHWRRAADHDAARQRERLARMASAP